MARVFGPSQAAFGRRAALNLRACGLVLAACWGIAAAPATAASAEDGEWQARGTSTHTTQVVPAGSRKPVTGVRFTERVEADSGPASNRGFVPQEENGNASAQETPADGSDETAPHAPGPRSGSAAADRSVNGNAWALQQGSTPFEPAWQNTLGQPGDEYFAEGDEEIWPEGMGPHNMGPDGYMETDSGYPGPWSNADEYQGGAPSGHWPLKHGSGPFSKYATGVPRRGFSNRFRPFYAGIFGGGMFPDDLIAGQLGQQSAFGGGVRLGWDFQPNWALEGRLLLSTLGLVDNTTANAPRDNQLFYGDLDLLFYPWGDTAVRPYLMVGLGGASFQYVTTSGISDGVTTMTLPLGVGIKQYLTDRLALRLDFVDNLAFAGGRLDTQHNLSLTGGLEWHFGGRRRSYWPWESRVSVW